MSTVANGRRSQDHPAGTGHANSQAEVLVLANAEPGVEPSRLLEHGAVDHQAMRP